MTKHEAVKQFVERDFSAVPQEWVRLVSEHMEGEEPIYALPMWGTMWIVTQYYGKNFLEHSRIMLSGNDELLDEVNQGEHSNYDEAERKAIKKAIKDDDYNFLEEYIDEEMSGARCILDKDGRTTAAYIYEVGDEYVMGVNGAGWNFYDGVWDKLYDLIGLKWHDARTAKI